MHTELLNQEVKLATKSAAARRLSTTQASGNGQSAPSSGKKGRAKQPATTPKADA